jgi:hypothetical protein
MFKGMKTTLVIVAMSLVGMVACNSECKNEGETTCDSTKTDSVACVMNTTTTEAVTVSDVSVTADSAQ